MKKMIKVLMSILIVSVVCSGFLVASSSAMQGMDDKAGSDKIGDLIHETKVDGYMLSYYFMDLRDKKENKKTMDMGDSKDMPAQQMDKPHHLMVYIMDKNNKPVKKGMVGFMIKDARGNAQKAMGMVMGDGFGTTADMKKKGVYTIVTKAMVNNTKLMYNFNYEIK